MSERPWVLLLVSAVLAAGCMQRTAGTPEANSLPVLAEPADLVRQAKPAAPAPAQPGAPAAADEARPGQPATALGAMQASRKLIRTGQMTLRVDGYEQAAARVAAIAGSYGGYLAESQSSRGVADRQHGALTVRVPAERFTAAFASLLEIGEVRSQNTSAQDVTREYTDLETRLRVKRDTAERLREILRTRTARLSDVLEAERELARVTEEIERMEGERRFYDQQVALSTITVALHEPDAVVAPGLLGPVRQALRDSLGVLATSVAGLIYAVVFLAPWLLVGLLAWRVVRVVRRRRTVRAAAS